MNRIALIDIGWMAGIIEGEGWFVLTQPKKNHKIGIVRVSAAMTDFDTIERLHRITGVGVLNERKASKRKKAQLSWVVNGREDVTSILSLIHPLMSIRRSARIQELLDHIEIWDAEMERRKTEFVCGHEKSEENSYDLKSGATACRPCNLERSKKRYYANKAAPTKHPTTIISKEIANVLHSRI